MPGWSSTVTWNKRSIRATINVNTYEGRAIYDAGNYTGIGSPTFKHLLKRRSISFVGEKCVSFVLWVFNAVSVKISPVLPYYCSCRSEALPF